MKKKGRFKKKHRVTFIISFVFVGFLSLSLGFNIISFSDLKDLATKQADVATPPLPPFLSPGEDTPSFGDLSGPLLSGGPFIVNHESIPLFDDLTQEQTDMVRDLNLLFRHQSVGGYMMRGLENLSVEMGPRFAILIIPDNVFGGNVTRDDYLTYGPMLGHLSTGGMSGFFNFYSGNTDIIDVGFTKYCYVNINQYYSAQRQFDSYKDNVDAFRAENPDKILIHFTMPLTTDEDEYNVERNIYRDLILAEYGDEYVFDIADLESWKDGEYATFEYGGETYLKMHPDYTWDQGHPNAVGGVVLAKALWVMFVQIAEDMEGDDDSLLIDFDYEPDIRTEAGYESFIPSLYSPEVGYGWVGGVPESYMVADEDLDFGWESFNYGGQVSLFRDCHTSLSVLSDFAVDLDPGFYQVSMAMALLEEFGDYGWWDYDSNVIIEDTVYDYRNVLMDKGYRSDRDRWFMIPVEVGDGQLNIDFETRSLLCGLKIEAIPRPSVTDVTGDLIHGQSMSISGSNFGVKDPVPPIMWDDFENGVLGEYLSDHTEWIPLYPVSPDYASTAYAGELSAHNTDRGNFNTGYIQFNDTPTLYTNYRYRFERVDQIGGNGTQKLSRLNSDNDYLGYGVYYVENGGFGYQHYLVRMGTGGRPNQQFAVGRTEQDQWENIEQYGGVSSHDGFDGTISFSRNGILLLNDWGILTRGGTCYPMPCLEPCLEECEAGCDPGDQSCLDACDEMCRDLCGEDCDFGLNRYLMGLMWDNTDNFDIFMDDVYVDDTYARIMLCNVSRWEERIAAGSESNCEIQIPHTTWNEGRIDFEVNLGRFDGSEDLYLFVIDEDGVVSDGYPVTMGGGGGIYADCSEVPPEILGNKNCVEVSECGNLDQNNAYYLLMNDISAERECFYFRGSNSVFDLNGLTITYTDHSPTFIDNYDFELGTGTDALDWDQTNAPSVIRVDDFPQARGSWVPEQLGSWAMKFPAGSSNEYIYSDWVDVIPDTYYVISALVHDSEYIDNGNFAIRVLDENDNMLCQVREARFADNWAANKCSHPDFPNRKMFLPTTNRVRLEVGMDSVSIHDFYLDSIWIGEAGARDGLNAEHYGIKTHWGTSDVRITNGNIVEGNSGSFGSIGLYLWGNGQNYEIDNLNFNVHRPDAFGLFVNNNLNGVSVHDNVIVQLPNRTHESHDGSAGESGIRLHSGGNSNVDIFDNQFNCAQGITLKGEGLSVHDNTFDIVSVGIHRYAVSTLEGNNIDIYNNNVNNTQGSGFFIERCVRNGRIYDNYVEIRDGPQEERGWTGKALWVRDLRDDYSCPDSTGNHSIYDNVFIGYAGIDLIRPGANSSVATVRLGAYDDAVGPIRFYNNYVEAHTNFVGSQDIVDPSGATALDLSDTILEDGITKYIFNNTIKSNHRLIGIGHGYGMGMKSHFEDNTFIKSDDADEIAGDWFYTIISGYWGGLSNSFLNTTFEGDASFDLEDLFFYEHAYDGGREVGFRGINISWYLDTIVTAGGSPVEARLEIYDLYGTKVVDRQIDGNDRSELLERTYTGRGNFDTNLVETYYMPYTVNVTYGGEIQTEEVELNETKVITFEFGGQGEICDNGDDDDGDGLTDCYDADCVGQMGPEGYVCCQNNADCVDDEIDCTTDCYRYQCEYFPAVCPHLGGCQDGVWCNGDEWCDPESEPGSGCQPGTPRLCDDEIDCTDDSCGAEGCVFVPNHDNCPGQFCDIYSGCVDELRGPPNIQSMQGDFENGETITLSGEYFGNKTPVEPYLYDNLINQQAYIDDELGHGDTIPVGEGYPWSENGDWNEEIRDNVKYWTLDPRTPGGAHYHSQGIGFLRGWDDIPEDTASHFYVNWYFRSDGEINRSNVSTKLLRAYSEDVYMLNGLVAWCTWIVVSGWLTGDPPDDTCRIQDWVRWDLGEDDYNSWHKLEFISNSDRDFANEASYKLLYDGQTVSEEHGRGGIRDINYIITIGFEPNYHEYYTHRQVDFGEIYVDTTFARIELGDSPVYDNCTHREIQIPHTTWNDNNIQFTVNLGIFDGSEDLHLFVTDHNGNVSEGFPVEMGGEEPTVPEIIDVDGPLEHGQNYTITGNYFGESPIPEFLLWEDFDNGVEGEELSGDPQIGSWELDTYGSYHLPYYDYDAHSSPFSVKYSQSCDDCDCGSNRQGFHTNFRRDLPEDKNKFFWSWWYKYQHPGNCGVVKLEQLRGTNENCPGVFSGGAGGTYFTTMYQLTDPQFDCYNPDNNEPWYTGAPEQDVWHRLDVVLEQSDPEVANGNIILYNNNQEIYRRENIVTRNMVNLFWDNAMFFYGYENTGPGFIETGVDDAYLASSWARIELCNNQNKSLATQCEIQIPYSWNDGTIQFTVNSGGFDGSEDLHLFVIDHNGNVSEGFPVTMGSPTEPGCDEIDTGGKQCVEIDGAWLGAHTEPYVLNELNTYYLLMQDVTTSGSGFVFAAENITFDLNQKTITFGTSNDEYRYGIALPPGYVETQTIWAESDIPVWDWNHDAKIMNGFIVQGPGNASNCYAIGARKSYNITVNEVTITIIGDDTWAMWLDHNDGPEIFGNTIYDETTVVSNRHTGRAAIDIAYPAFPVDVHDNVIFNNKHLGIRVDGGDLSGLSPGRIYNNMIYPATIATNGYGIQIHRGDTYRIYNNTINATNGRGVHLYEGVNVEISNNWISVVNEPFWDEYTRVSAHGIKLEDCVNADIHDNTVYSYGLVNTPDAVSNGVPLSLSLEAGSNSRIYDNYFETRHLGGGAFDPSDIQQFTSSIEIFNVHEESNLKIENNTFVTNDRFFTSREWLDPDPPVNVNDMKIVGNTWIREQTSVPTAKKDLYFFNSEVIELRFIDNVGDINFTNFNNGWPGYPNSWSVGHTGIIRTRDSDLTPMPDIQVEIRNVEGEFIHTITTDDNGEYSISLDEFTVYVEEDFVDEYSEIIYHTPYNFTAYFPNGTQSALYPADYTGWEANFIFEGGSGEEPTIPEIINVDGPLEQGQNYTISGIGFGTKENAAPVKYDDFEDGILDQELSGWAFTGSPHPIYSDDYLRTGSDRSAKCLFEDGAFLSSFGVQAQEEQEEVYIDTWYLYDPADPPSRNHKLFRFYSGPTDGDPDLGYVIFCDPDAQGSVLATGTGLPQNCGDYIEPPWSTFDKQWVHIQGYFKHSGLTEPWDGIMHMWFNSEQTAFIDDCWTRSESAPDMWESFWFGNYLGHEEVGNCPASPGDSYTYWDNTYIDFTRARIEIGNAPVYEDCTHREIQIPHTTWEDGTIQFTANLGTFEEYDNLSLFVVNENGNVSEGFPIPTGIPEDEICDNGRDDDWDGYVDCEDSDCDGQMGDGGVCEFGTELTCDDGFDNDADRLIDCDDSDCTCLQTYNLEQGLNFIAMSLRLDDMSIETVFEPVLDDLRSIYTYEDYAWKVYHKGTPELTTLSELRTKQAYIVVMNDDSILTLEGNTINETISLNVGWNLVGISEETQVTIEYYLGENAQYVNSIWEWDVSGDYTLIDESDYGITYFEPGKLYWIEATQSFRFSPEPPAGSILDVIWNFIKRTLGLE